MLRSINADPTSVIADVCAFIVVTATLTDKFPTFPTDVIRNSPGGTIARRLKDGVGRRIGRPHCFGVG